MKLGISRERYGAWKSKFTLRRRIIFTMIVLIVLTTLFLGLLLYKISKSTIEKNYQNAHINNLQVSSKMMDIYLQDIIDQGRTLLENNKLITIMKEETNEDGYFSSKNQLAIDKTLISILSQDNLINGMLLVNETGNWRYNSKSKIYSGYLNHYYTTDQLLEEDWIQVAREAKGKEVFYPYDVLLGDKAVDCFCYVKNLIEPITQKSFGYLVVSIDKNIWKETFGNNLEGFSTNRYMVMLHEDGLKDTSNVVYFTGEEEEKWDILHSYYGKNKEEYLFSSYINDITGWSVMNVITKDELEKDSNDILKILFIALLILIVVSINASTILASHITKPLDKFAKSIAAVEVGKLRVDTEFDNSEVGRIGNQFKQLVNNNLELQNRLLNMEIKQRDAQLLLLQSEINPHFLYNTLDSLYFMAIIEHADDIAEMVQSLSNIFRLSLNKGDKLILVRDEIQRMSDYMKIQNHRFHNRFTLHIDVEDHILDTKILNFLLQPIIENAVYHGLESKVGPGNIHLSGRLVENNLHFTIRDDGIGISDPKKIEQGYALKNIKERIHLFYGEIYYVDIVSEEEVGTTVNIVIPVMKEENHV